MDKKFTTEKKYIKAKQRVEEIKGFYQHLFATVLIIPAIIFVNAKFNLSYHWLYFPIIGMSLGLLIHWFGIFGIEIIGLGKNWEERKIKELMKEEEKYK